VNGNAPGSPNGTSNVSGADNGAGTGTGTGTGVGSGPSPFGVGSGTGSGEGPRHIVYLLDISESMTSRLDRAKSELRAALNGLDPSESFDIILFYGDSDAFDDGLVPADKEQIAQASSFLDGISLKPGTNLEDGLRRALSMPGVNVVVVLTDGVPTVGQTNFKKLAKDVRRLNVNRARIYTVGLVGKNPDGTDDSFEATRLLQQISADSGGESKLVSLGVATPD
jgi:hypothetical protein